MKYQPWITLVYVPGKQNDNGNYMNNFCLILKGESTKKGVATT